MEQTYKGGCHCGAVSYEVTADVKDAITCNCSICTMRGHVLSFTPADKFTLLSGEDNLTDYQFGSRTVHHLFCKTCGVNSFGAGTMPDGTEMRAINLRCLEDLDMSSLKITEVNGKDF